MIKQDQTISLLTALLILSILLHFFLLMGVSIIWDVHPAHPEPPPSMEVPAYFYRDQGVSGAALPSPATHQAKTEDSQSGEKIQPAKTNISKKQSVNEEANSPTTTPTEEEPIHLVGDKNTPPKPLAKIIGRALTKKLTYPKIAVDFRLKGIVYVGFSLHPDGHLSGIKLVESSRAGVLDEAALAAVSAISPLPHVEPYVSKPRYLVIGIIFR